MSEAELGVQQTIGERVKVVSRILVIVIGDALIFGVWCLVDFGLHRLAKHLEIDSNRGISPAAWFLIVSEWATFLVAVVYILYDLVGAVNELVQFVKKKRSEWKVLS